LKDPQGTFVIQRLIQLAREGGGYQRYIWEKPSTGEIADKIGYAAALEKWGWMLGTGLYIDDVLKQVHAKEIEVSARVRQTSLIIIFITLGALGTVFATGLAINFHERRMSDAKLKELTQRIVETQEEERSRVARELHDGISQILVSVKYALELAMYHAQ
jgi:two-component system NarL family sensor kinase